MVEKWLSYTRFRYTHIYNPPPSQLHYKRTDTQLSLINSHQYSPRPPPSSYIRHWVLAWSPTLTSNYATILHLLTPTFPSKIFTLDDGLNPLQTDVHTIVHQQLEANPKCICPDTCWEDALARCIYIIWQSVSYFIWSGHCLLWYISRWRLCYSIYVCEKHVYYWNCSQQIIIQY